MLRLKKKDARYLYLVPASGKTVEWEVIDQEELDERVKHNKLAEGAKLFKIDKEINIRFETTIHLE